MAKGAQIALPAVLVVLAALGSSACAGDFDTSRKIPARGSLGREMYTMICDRVGAQALREDVTGESFHAVCHADSAGAFVDTVDVTKLPPPDPSARDIRGNRVSLEQQAANRAHRIARVEALARRRGDLVSAFDAALTNETLGIKDLDAPDPRRSCDPPSDGRPGEADVRTELAAMLGRVSDLYEDDTIPHLTRALASVMNDVEGSPEAQAALARFDGRRGYRPADTAMGVARPLLSYPRLAPLTRSVLTPLAKGGKARPQMETLAAVMREELRTAKRAPDLPLLVTRTEAAAPDLVRLSRPRQNLEIARELLLLRDPAFAASDRRWIVARDPRGVARVAVGAGGLPAPFVDEDGDGLADVDVLGRFVTKGATAPAPFPAWDDPSANAVRDSAGRALVGDAPAFDYVDVSSTLLASLSRDLVPMLEPDVAREHETVMDLLAGLYVVSGAREHDPVERDYGAAKVPYRPYRKDTSPLLDLVHAIGQVLGHEAIDDTLALLHALARDKPEVLARLAGVGLKIKAIADAHPEASLPEASTLWDEMLDVVGAIAQKPELVENILRAFGDPTILDLPRSAGAYLTMRDELTYDRSDLNGLPRNLTTGKVEAPRTPVDRSRPDTGDNRSEFQRFLQAIHDTKGMSACTKPGAVAHIVWNGIPLDFPSTAARAACFVLGNDPPPNPMPMCGMLRIKNIAAELVDAVLGTMQLDIRDDCLKNLVASPLTGIVGGANAFLQDVSGIDGWHLNPTVPALSRMVYFDQPHDGLPGDTQNPKTRNFFRDLFDPAPTLVCPEIPFTDTDGTKLNLRQCSAFADTIRGRDRNALFPLEQLGFLEAVKPLARAFKKSDASLLFVDLFDVLHRHWGSNRQSREECDPKAPKTNARWCSQDGAVMYEPLVAEALASDLFPALHDSVASLSATKVAHCTERSGDGTCTKSAPRDGVTVLAELVETLVDPTRNKGLAHRSGDSSVVYNDGVRGGQLTPIHLLIDALKGFDRRFAEHAHDTGEDRRAAWKRARSQITDQLFAVEGSGAASKWKNPAIEKTLPVLASTLRSQVLARCADPSRSCRWAREELPKNLEDVVTGPTYASVLEVIDALRGDEGARTEIERLLVHLLQGTEASWSTLTALVDLLQIFEDDANMTALLHALASAAGPEITDAKGQTASRGFLLAAIEVLVRVLGEVRDESGARVCSKEIDPNGALAVVLRKLVALPPRENGVQPPPIEVLIDVVADVNRRHPETTTKLEGDDYASIAREVSEFCTHPSRGLEQVYTVIKQATKDQ